MVGRYARIQGWAEEEVSTMDSATVYVGIDVAKAALVIAVRPTGACWETVNQTRAFPALIRHLRTLCPTRIIVEATGPFHQPLVRALTAAGLPIAVANPQRVRYFAKGVNRTAKTDKIDAHVLAHYAEAVPMETRPALSAEAEQLRELTGRRRKLVQARTAELQRQAFATGLAARQIRTHLRLLDAQITEIEQAVSRLLQEPRFAGRAAILRSIPGIGPQSVVALLTELPELGEATAKQVAALSGVAPYNRDSGTLRGKRRIQGGRSSLRATLYPATLAAIRCNSSIRDFYLGLVARGKAKKLAIIAAERKLLMQICALIREDRLWEDRAAA
jgi:transposase